MKLRWMASFGMGLLAVGLLIPASAAQRLGQWTTAAPMPGARTEVAVAEIAGKVYVVGGRIDGSFARNLRVNEEYDPETDRWWKRAPMPTARHGLGAVAIGGRIFVVSGGPRPGGSSSGLNEVFTP
ncbi:MAG: hypothetical protein ACE5JD_06680 [Candidatus Methylomirabilia bacterium]